ncbi:ABC transporter permease subunit [Neobacillus massiliamazoniensis]|uniref:Binding-protein-dependent transport system inner membrane protein n=1 Tax=Neobacillus massiliamazoniensis TaxID=1499688 RepID=A0A0U1NUK4_9BACI|nr:ABC transporter permease subunit [Neobacillus massiliamazoniensis]CRK81737.1 binding-protein-dependent transport system inner membrane protein [Neobacillus massiliamazoniensis]
MIVIKKIMSLILQCKIAIAILILIGVLPVLFHDLSFHPDEYVQAIYNEAIHLFTLTHLSYNDRNSIFSVIFFLYFDSMRILGLGLILAVIIALLNSYVALIFFRKKINLIKKLIELLESIPDLMFILLLQMLVIYIYKKTGVRIAQVVSLREKAILLPVICMAVPISFYITKVLIHYIEEEMEKNYIVLAKSKGFSFVYILNKHVLRNIVEGMHGTSKTVIWSMLSTLLVVDYLFNMNGLLRMMATTPDAFIVGCMMIFIPFFILYRIYEWTSFDHRKDTH